MAQQRQIDLFYSDECRVSLVPCVPYGWRFKDEQLSIPSTSGRGVNCFALLACDNCCFFRLTQESIDAATICDYLDQFSQHLPRPTVVVLDNAPAHQGEVKKRRAAWEAKGLYILFLPVYSPELNIAEILW
ncbi:MAG: transposase, partial [Fibrella sp.]|nr:transposase [Armatimonadota bacterium]